MVQAVLAIEDRRFFEHSGVNFVLDHRRRFGTMSSISGRRRADRRSRSSWRADSF